jgi:hypothetical protein
MTDAGEEFYRHAVVMLRDAELAESAIRHRVTEPTGTVRCTAAMTTMQFAICDIVADFLLRYPKVMSSHMQPTGTSISSTRITTSRSEPGDSTITTLIPYRRAAFSPRYASSSTTPVSRVAEKGAADRPDH